MDKDSMEQAKGQEAYCERCEAKLDDEGHCWNRDCSLGAENLFWERVDYEYDRKKDR